MLDQAVTNYLPLVRSIAKGYAGQGLDYEDIIQEGTVGLMTAAKNYNSEKDNGFAAYAVPCIHNKIKDALKREASQCNPKGSISFDEHPALKEMLEDPSPSPEDIVCNNELHSELQVAMDACLNKIETMVIKLRYWDSMTPYEVAKKMSIPVKIVNTIEQRAIEVLRNKRGGPLKE